MTLVQLEYILAVDEHRHFAKAAADCFVTQPTLSMQIQKLEDELGIKLFDRSRQPVVPTPIGELMIGHARKVMREVKQMEDAIKEKQGLIHGELRLGIIPTLAPYLLPLFLQSFLDRFPDVQLKVKEMTTDNLVDALLKGHLDMGLAVTPLQHNTVMEYPLFYEEMMAYVSKKNAAYKKTYVLAKDIDVNELWLLEEGNCLRSQMLNLCELQQAHKDLLLFEYEAGSLETLKRMVETNRGITILPELATFDLSAAQLKLIRHFRSPAPMREVSLLTAKSFVKQKQLAALKEVIMLNIPEKIRKNKARNVIPV
ncbi:hydrogen peroxide-inducible genes activator [Flavihumibacter profundi]|jgi:LysR family transcriptional regulator, hydrogen peroxide-inducible genes activator|uniref:hydrogen peroxide-inducible genes activator n=1 Tax=Flavihumibacter profundi TaxID=2716883 RepID=UPI001CC7F20B|nr:hydrogen peroxide-inducible genes activator [Flavihumibacter profundi]MBZ5858273.1 hydrogen peroxide-inducible genes activator [Flavihumibacter profundi]